MALEHPFLTCLRCLPKYPTDLERPYNGEENISAPHHPLCPVPQRIPYITHHISRTAPVAQPTMSHTIHIHRSVISPPSRMSSTRPIINEWASVVSRRKLQLACAGGRRDVSILHRLVLVSNFARAHEDECAPPPAPTTPQPEFVFPDMSAEPQPTLDEAGWLDAILQELEEEAEVMVSCLPEESCAASTSDAPADDDVIVCDSYFSICSCEDPDPAPTSLPDELSDSLSDLPFYSTPSLDSSSMDIDSDEEGPTTPSTSFVDADTPQDCHDPYEDALPPLFEEPISRPSIIRTCIPYNPLSMSPTYC